MAVEISNEKAVRAITEFQSRINIDAKPVESHNLHFTLQFLGEISGEIAEKVCTALRKIEFASFLVKLRCVGAFPKLKFPRVVWIGTDEYGGSCLSELAKKVEVVLEPLGFSNNKFRPHVTILRVKNRTKLEAFEPIEFGAQKISSIKLKQSVLSAHGPTYSDLEEIKASL